MNAYIIEENENKYLIFASTENNRKIFEMYKKLWSKIKTQSEINSVETINSSKCNLIASIKDEKNPMKIRFVSFYDNDDLPLDKVLCLSDLNIIVETDFQIKDKYHSQTHIHECEYKEYE